MSTQLLGVWKQLNQKKELVTLKWSELLSQWGHLACYPVIAFTSKYLSTSGFFGSHLKGHFTLSPLRSFGKCFKESQSNYIGFVTPGVQKQ